MVSSTMLESSLEGTRIESLKRKGLTSNLVDMRKRVIDSLASYGESASPAIREIVDVSITYEVKKHGLKA